MAECTLKTRCNGKEVINRSIYPYPAVSIASFKTYQNLEEQNGRPPFRSKHFWCKDCTTWFFTQVDIARREMAAAEGDLSGRSYEPGSEVAGFSDPVSKSQQGTDAVDLP